MFELNKALKLAGTYLKALSVSNVILVIMSRGFGFSID